MPLERESTRQNDRTLDFRKAYIPFYQMNNAVTNMHGSSNIQQMGRIFSLSRVDLRKLSP